MISGPVVIQILQADNAVELYRNIMGATDPSLAEENTIRKLYGQSIQCNAVHGSDSIENAKIESSFFFSKLELTI
jgi:nucleoside-diphosphate kinase